MNQRITACAFLHHDGKLFIAKRATTKKLLPGKFELPGGHIEVGEDLVSGLKRELQEELGINEAVGDPLHAFTYINGDEHVIEVDFMAQPQESSAKIVVNPEDHAEFRWVTKEEVDEVWDKNDAEYVAIQKGFVRLRLN